MKYKFLLIAAFIFIVKAADAQSERAKLLLGKWNVESLTPKFADGATAKDIKSGKKVIASDLKDFKKTGFTFTADGTLLVHAKKFHWEMNTDEKTVNITQDGKAVTTGTIVGLTERRLVFTRPDDGMIVTYVLVR